MGVTTASDDQNQSEIQPKSATVLSPAFITQTQQSSQQQYEILGIQGDGTDAYYSSIPDYCDLNSGNTESPAVRPTSKEDNGENVELCAVKCSGDEYEEIGHLDAEDSSKTYLELTL